MKFYKRLPINRKNPMDTLFAVEENDEITTTSDSAMQMPRGTTASRPPNPKNGEIRFNANLGIDGGELEAYINGEWIIIKTNKQSAIRQQIFTNGDYADTYFGPLAFDVAINKPANIFVYVENLPQIANENFVLAYSSTSTPITTSTLISGIVPASSISLPVTSVADFNPGNPITGTNIRVGTTVVSTSATDLTITLSTSTTNSIPANERVYSSFATTGTYVKFINGTMPVPNKPVVTLIGFDGFVPI